MVDEVTLLRYRQHARSLEDERAFQRRTLQPVVIGEGRRRLVVEADEGVHDTTAEALRALVPTVEGGVVTFGRQTHPADGSAGCVVLDDEGARALSGGNGVVRSLAAGFARAEKAHVPKAATIAAMNALNDAGL